MEFLNELSVRNPALYYFGWLCLGGALLSAIMTQVTDTEVLGINAWIKPFKFYMSSWIFAWSIGWYMHYLSQQSTVNIFSWVVIVVFIFELVYITWQAAKGELSHFNMSSSFHGTMWSIMGFAISMMTLFTAYIGILFFTSSFPDLPNAYVWGIRLGIVMFVIFAFEGGLMGARLSHTVGASDGSAGLPVVNWSKSHGDLRIAHFLGMHALQILPILGFYLFQSTRVLIIVSIIYFITTSAVLVQALMGIPLFRN